MIIRVSGILRAVWGDFDTNQTKDTYRLALKQQTNEQMLQKVLQTERPVLH